MTHDKREPIGADSSESGSPAGLVNGRGVAGILLAVWLAITLARLLAAEPLASANDRSRWCTVWSLVEEGTFRIDTIRQRPGWDTIDLVRHDGHFYSTKPPVFPALVAGLYWLEKQTVGWALDDEVEATTRLLLLFVNVLPLLIALGLFAGLLRRHTTSLFAYAFVMATACFGTLACPFTNVLNNHTPGIVCVLLTLCAAVPVLAENRRDGWRFAMTGFWAAWACSMELPAAALGVAMFLLLFRADRRRTMVWFVPAAVVPLAAFFVTNYLATGDWKPFYLYYGTEKYEFIHNGVPSYWMHPRGIDQAKDSPLVYFLHCTIGHHGVVSLSPVFLLTLWSWLRCSQWRHSRLKEIHWLGLGLTVLVFGFFMTKTENYNYGGVSVALRWLLWLTPFWLLAMVPLLESWNPGRWGRLVCVTLLGVSTFSAWYPLDGPWKQPWLFNLLSDVGWIDYSDPAPTEMPPFHSWIRTLPSTSDEAPQADYWIEFAGVDGDGRWTTLRLADAGGVDVRGRHGRRIDVIRSVEGEPPQTQQLTLDSEALAVGAEVEEILLWPDGDPSDAERKAAIEFVRGLPAVRSYAPGKLRYIDSPLRAESFQTRHAASRVWATPPEHPQRTIYRRDVWTTDAVPFGVLEYRITLQDGASGETLRRTTMRAVAAGRVEPFDEASLVFE